MGVTRHGRFAAVTNFRDPSDKRLSARSRGELVTAFLLSDAAPKTFLTAMQKRAHEYNGFNLIAGDISSLAYFSSRDGTIDVLESGCYALSNHTLNEPWPKVAEAKSALEALLQAEMAEGERRMAIYALLTSQRIASDHELPDTGVGIEWERLLSSALIVSPKYGTRASTILSVAKNGGVSFEEHTRMNDGRVSHVATFNFELAPS